MSTILVRPLHPDDAPTLHAIITLPQVARNLLQIPGKTLASTIEWANKTNPFRHRFVAKYGGVVVGMGSLTQMDRPRLFHSGTLGLYVHPDYWGKGIGTAIMAQLLDAADNWLNLKRVELDVFTDNAAAIRLYEKFGFVSEGVRRKVAFRDGALADDLCMARLRNATHLPIAEAAPLPPKPSPLPTNTPVTIRPYQTEDAAALHTFFTRPDVTRTLNRMLYQEFIPFKERLDKPPESSHHLVAVVNGQAVGDIFLHIPPNPRLKHSAVLGMALHPDYWGLGLGSRLMAAMLDLADNWLNLQRVELTVNSHNAAAIRLYQKHGFIIEGTKHYHGYGDGLWAHSHFMGRVRD